MKLVVNYLYMQTIAKRNLKWWFIGCFKFNFKVNEGFHRKCIFNYEGLCQKVRMSGVETLFIFLPCLEFNKV
jgi:hypothetical protein